MHHQAVAVAAQPLKRDGRAGDVATQALDPYRLTHYRESIGQRVNADPQDAQLLARYLSREAGALRQWQPMTHAERHLWQLLKRRATLVRARVQLKQSLCELSELQDDVDAFLARFEHLIGKMERALMTPIEQLGWANEVRRWQALPGVGPLSALGLVATYHRGQFRSADAFIAFLGMDVRLRESGKYRGRCKLTKNGDSELRRLLFNAAMQARRNPL